MNTKRIEAKCDKCSFNSIIVGDRTTSDNDLKIVLDFCIALHKLTHISKKYSIPHIIDKQLKKLDKDYFLTKHEKK